MIGAWRWQDDALWQSCPPEARHRAEQWLSDRATLQQQLVLLAGQQPLISPDMGITEHASALKACSRQLVVIGTGGASLGAQAICALGQQPEQVRFLENCDPVTLESFLQLPMEETSWLVISKSGQTIETVAAALMLAEAYGRAGVELAPRLRVITGSGDHSLRRLASKQGWTMLVHPDALGGRFSVFSLVGLLPASYAGIDTDAVLDTARTTLDALLAAPDESLLSHAAWFAANTAEKPIHLLMAYADRLRASTQWYKQLWAESLGKNGKGPTPVTAIGAIDQHSQLQLYLDGPRDKLVTLWLPQSRSQLPPLRDSVAGMEYLAGRNMADVMQATADATATTLMKAGVPMRIARGVLSPQTLAEWMMRQMLETLAVATLLEVDPYSQPAVEEGKKLTRAALKEMA
jgi:glucose-6-phosphate isomerase